MGEVYLGYDQRLERSVAIKVIRQDRLNEETKAKYLKRFENEAKATAKFTHENIVRVFDVGQENGLGPYMVCEYVPGMSLRQMIARQGPLPAASVVSIADELASAIDAAHQAKILHRDIKPDNVLMSEEGTAKLADFGIARLPNAGLTSEGQFLGTPCYAAPETLQGGEYSVRGEVFSFATLLYEVITGTRAYPGQDAIKVAQRIITSDPPLVSSADAGMEVPKELDKIFQRAMHAEPEKRYPSASAFADEVIEAYETAGLVESLPRVELEQSRVSGMAYFALSLLIVSSLAAAFVIFLDPLAESRSSEQGSSEETSGIIYDDPEKTLEVERAKVDAVRVSAQEAEDAATESIARSRAEVVAEAIPNLSSLSSVEKEIKAKDWLDIARAAIRSSDARKAQDALWVAEALDPSHPDLPRLNQQLESH